MRLLLEREVASTIGLLNTHRSRSCQRPLRSCCDYERIPTRNFEASWIVKPESGGRYSLFVCHYTRQT